MFRSITRSILISTLLLASVWSLAIPASVVRAAGTVTLCPTDPQADYESMSLALQYVPDGGTIQFTCDATIPVYSTIGIESNVTIDGNGRAAVLDASYASSDVQAMRVVLGMNVTLKGMTIANGRALQGGAISNYGNLTIADSTLRGNSSVGSVGDSAGGAIYNAGWTCPDLVDTSE